MPTQPDPVADAAGQSEEHASARPGFFQHITSALQHGEGIRAYGFYFADPNRDLPCERYAMLIQNGMSPIAVADALEKIAHQMRTRTGANDTERLEGNEVNAADFPPGKVRPL